jgi:hypothetical protein
MESVLNNPENIITQKKTIKEKMEDFTTENSFTIVHIFYGVFVMLLIILAVWLIASSSSFSNYDPYGMGTRYFQSRSDTGADDSTPRERLLYKSNLTSTPQPPTFEERYGVDAKIENGSVMIERENFTSKGLSDDDLVNSMAK